MERLIEFIRNNHDKIQQAFTFSDSLQRWIVMDEDGTIEVFDHEPQVSPYGYWLTDPELSNNVGIMVHEADEMSDVYVEDWESLILDISNMITYPHDACDSILKGQLRYDEERKRWGVIGNPSHYLEIVPPLVYETEMDGDKVVTHTVTTIANCMRAYHHKLDPNDDTTYNATAVDIRDLNLI